MYKKLICVTFLVLVLSLTSTVGAKPNDPVGWWKLDEGNGNTVAIDSSSNGNNGSLTNMTGNEWAEGKIGGALEFDGDNDYVDIGDNSVFDITGNITLAAWIKVDSFTKNYAIIVCKGDANGWSIGRNSSTSYLIFTCSTDRTNTVTGNTAVDDGQWHHVAGVYNGSTMYLYLDGEVDNSKSLSGAITTNAYNVYIGKSDEHPNSWWNGLIDDVRIYDRALSEEEIQELASDSGGVLIAADPRPKDNEIYVDLNVVINWSRGADANSHDVYLGTNFYNVRDATTTVQLGVYKGNFSSAGYDPCGLELDTVYYWRIDEVNGPNTWKGDVWRLTTIYWDANNLLANSSFKDGSGSPDNWTTVTSAGTPTYTWDSTKSYKGSYSAKIECADANNVGMWQQVVPVTEGTVYTLIGYISFADFDKPGECHFQVAFRDASHQIIQFVDLPDHHGNRNFAVDLPYNLKFRAPGGAVEAEVNCYLKGPGTAWFDDVFFGPAAIGNIAGTVTSGGQPIENVHVFMNGEPWNKVCEDYTDQFGDYLIEDMPVAFPRYVMLAEKNGYKTKAAGRVDVPFNGTVTVNFDLDDGSDPYDVNNLQVKYGCLELSESAPSIQVPTDAVIPADANGYPAKVREFLKSDRCITPDNLEVMELGEYIINGMDTEDTNNTHKVAWAVYEWIAKNINHNGGVFGDMSAPYTDVTSGRWQGLSADGWCWGENFYDWGYKPAESLDVKNVICVEHSWLASAILRYLNIPARARVGAAQFWVQKPGEYGYWVGMSTPGGSNNYRINGTLGAGFGGAKPLPSYFSVISEPFLQEDWTWQNEGLRKETHPWTESYPATQDGLEQANADMNEMEATGNAPHGPGAGGPGNDRYMISYSHITLGLYNIGTQRILDTRFPIVSESEYHHLEPSPDGRKAWWTNHPECVTHTYIEEITNPPTEGTQRWFHIVFDLTDMLGVSSLDDDSNVNLDGNYIVNVADLAYLAEYWLWQE